MIQPANSEVAFQNLLTLLAATQLNGANAFVTASRRLPAVANVNAAQQPALYILEGEEDVSEANLGLPVEELKCAVIVLFQVPADSTTVTSTQLNALRDAVVNQLRQTMLTSAGTVAAMPAGSRQTLGGAVYHCRIIGKVLKNEGLQNQQGAIVFPISILTGM